MRVFYHMKDLLVKKVHVLNMSSGNIDYIFNKNDKITDDKKPIWVDTNVFGELNLLEEIMEEKLGKNQTHNNAIHLLIDSYKRKGKVEQELKKTIDYFKMLLEKSLNNPSAGVITKELVTPATLRPPPSPKPLMTPKSPPIDTANLKKSMLSEMKQILTPSEINIKPSDVQKIVSSYEQEPKEEKEKVEELTVPKQPYPKEEEIVEEKKDQDNIESDYEDKVKLMILILESIQNRL